jgi:hypothetical protein
MSLISDLAQAPADLPTPSRFTALSGVLYAAAGLVFLAWPGIVQTVFRDPAFIGRDESLMRVLGMVVAIVGWLYFFGGRSGGRQFVAATVVDRLVLVPAVLVPTAAAGVFPHVMLTFAVLDPALAIVAWHLLSRKPS